MPPRSVSAMSCSARTALCRGTQKTIHGQEMPMPIHTAAAAACHLCGLAASSWSPRAGRGGASTGSAGRASASRCCHRRCSAVAAMIAPHGRPPR
eukprot:6177199-Pleurochrysis_carterae.AAC.1